MTSNYFPLKTGNTWVYDVKGENNYRTEVVVTQMEVTGGDTLFLVDVGGDMQYFQRQSAMANRVRELSATYEGDEVIFGTIYEPYILLPPIEGEDWEREFNFSLVYRGEPLEKNFSISVDSVISTSIVINSENYENVYRLKRTVVEDSDSIVEYEWFAPNIGLIKKEIPADSLVWEIVSFDFNE
jgi:hypothetical protein